jgi:hypothetical protein
MSTTSRALENSFHSMVFSELNRLKEGEKRLERLYPRLQANPQLRGRFLRELAAVQQRADRLDEVLLQPPPAAA